MKSYRMQLEEGVQAWWIMQERVQLALGIYLVLCAAFFAEQILNSHEEKRRAPAAKYQSNEKVDHKSFVEIERYYHLRGNSNS